MENLFFSTNICCSFRSHVLLIVFGIHSANSLFEEQCSRLKFINEISRAEHLCPMTHSNRGQLVGLDSAKMLTTNAGIKMPRIIYGTAWKKERTTEFVVTAFRLGFRGVDTACQPKHYYEPGVGQALEQLYSDKTLNIRRENLFLQTKFTSLDGQDPNNVPYDTKASLVEQVKQSLQTSLKNLKTDYIDSLVMHSPMRTFDKTMEVWHVFEEFVDEGKVLQLGISNIYDFAMLRQIYAAGRIKPAVIQNRFYRESGYDKEIRQFCNENGIIYQSFWSLTANPHILKNAAFTKVVEKYGNTPAQTLFRFLMNIGIAPLTGTTDPEHMKQDLDVLAMDKLSTEEIESIKKLLH